MKKLLFTLSIMLFFAPTCFSQTTFSEFTPEKSNYINTYTPQEITWLNKKGFNMLSYSGQNKKINFYLDLAVKHRKTRNRFLLYGGLGFVFGSILVNIGSNRLNSPNGSGDQTLFITVTGLVVSGSSFWGGLIGGLINDNRAKRNARTAIIALQLDLD